MRKGGGKGKGASFERSLCVKFSLWVSGGKRRDLFWRTAMSGGRATVAHRRSIEQSNAAGRPWPARPPVRQAGDMCSVSPEGHALTDVYYFEFKHYRDIKLDAFVISRTGPIAGWWKKACKEAREHKREPVLIVKGNHMPILIISLEYHVGSMLNSQPVARLKDCVIGLLDRTLNQKFDDWWSP